MLKIHQICQLTQTMDIFLGIKVWVRYFWWIWRELNPCPNRLCRFLYTLSPSSYLLCHPHGQTVQSGLARLSWHSLLTAWLTVCSRFLWTLRSTAAISAELWSHEGMHCLSGQCYRFFVVSEYCLVSDLRGVHHPRRAATASNDLSKPVQTRIYYSKSLRKAQE